MKIGIVVFPGSNCDQDCFQAIQKVTGHTPVFLWHKDHNLQDVDAIVLPGGFSYGDYLRSGAIARYSPIMQEVKQAADAGKPVLGICNGFQILTEAGLLPGTLMRNSGLNFICKTVDLKLENADTPFTKKGEKGKIYRIPIAHMDGNYQIDEEGLKRIEGEGQVAFRYQDNPNGSKGAIAGVTNAARNVVGLMPHPERVCDAALGGIDGEFFFQSLAS